MQTKLGRYNISENNIHEISEIKRKVTYRITGNFSGVKFLRFWSKKKTFNFCGFLFLRIVNLGTEKKIVCITGFRKQQVKRCYDKQLVHITVILRSKNIFSSLESFQTLQLLNTHLVNFKFALRN